MKLMSLILVLNIKKAQVEYRAFLIFRERNAQAESRAFRTNERLIL